MLREHKIFKSVHNDGVEKIDAPIREVPANTFKKICAYSGDGSLETHKIENEKTKKTGFIIFLQKRYNKRLALKMASLFDWGTQFIKYEPFYKTIENLILRPSENFDECLSALKLLTFNLYDLNNDLYICEADLFSLLKAQSNDKFFKDVIYRDIMDI